MGRQQADMDAYNSFNIVGSSVYKGLWGICSYVGEPMSPWIFPFLFIFRYMKIEFMIPLVFIFVMHLLSIPIRCMLC